VIGGYEMGMSFAVGLFVGFAIAVLSLWNGGHLRSNEQYRAFQIEQASESLNRLQVPR
jgi:hypothetical protein